MRRFEVGDRVRIDIPDRNDPDFQQYHGRTGEVIDLLTDDATAYSGDERGYDGNREHCFDHALGGVPLSPLSPRGS